MTRTTIYKLIVGRYLVDVLKIGPTHTRRGRPSHPRRQIFKYETRRVIGWVSSPGPLNVTFRDVIKVTWQNLYVTFKPEGVFI